MAGSVPEQISFDGKWSTAMQVFGCAGVGSRANRPWVALLQELSSDNGGATTANGMIGH